MITPIMGPLFSITKKTIRSCKKIATMNCAKYIKQRSTVYSVAGRGHTGKGIECEDITYLAETPKIRFFGLADGQSGKRCCREGGRAVLAAVFQFVASADITQLIQYKYVDELQYKIISVIRDTIDRLAASGRMDRAEYASTLVAFAYDIWTGQYIYNCNSNIRKAPYVGLAMFTLFALLGPDGFKVLLPSPSKAGDLFFAL